jgi:hypothetical protein
LNNIHEKSSRSFGNIENNIQTKEVKTFLFRSFLSYRNYLYLLA